MDILHTTQVISDGWGVLLFIAVIGAVSTGIFGVMLLSCADNAEERMPGVILTLICVILIIVAVAIGNIPEPITQHQAVITDMAEFDTEKYEIIDVEGRIFTINERN